MNGGGVDDKKEDDEKVRFFGFEIMKIEELVSFFLKLFFIEISLTVISLKISSGFDYPWKPTKSTSSK